MKTLLASIATCICLMAAMLFAIKTHNPPERGNGNGLARKCLVLRDYRRFDRLLSADEMDAVRNNRPDQPIPVEAYDEVICVQ